MTLTSPSLTLRSSVVDALERPASPGLPQLAAADVVVYSLLSSPTGSSSSSVGFMDMSDLMLPASALESELFGVPQDSGATVISTASSDESIPSEVVTSTPTMKVKQRNPPSSSERRHSLPSAFTLSSSPGDGATQPVPEFLCHLFSMVRDPSHAGLISWVVPSSDESDHQGGGVAHKGKIVVHEPESLQDEVLGKYYRHSKYASFQRQLNYFGFKKRLHGGKKGKLSPCSYIHDLLTEEVESLFGLKRRPPSKKRALEADDASVSEASTGLSSRKRKKCRGTAEKVTKDGSSKSKREKKQKNQSKQQAAPDSDALHQVGTEGYAPRSVQDAASIDRNQLKAQPSTDTFITSTIASTSTVTTATNNLVKLKEQVVSQPPMASQPPTSTSPASSAAQPSLLELLSTSLPPSDVLFDDTFESESIDDNGMPAWVSDDGKYHYHNVDSSLIDLAMLY